MPIAAHLWKQRFQRMLVFFTPISLGLHKVVLKCLGPHQNLSFLNETDFGWSLSSVLPFFFPSLLSLPPNALSATLNQKWQPIHYAVNRGHVLCVSKLLEFKADVSATIGRKVSWCGVWCLHVRERECVCVYNKTIRVRVFAVASVCVYAQTCEGHTCI